MEPVRSSELCCIDKTFVNLLYIAKCYVTLILWLIISLARVLGFYDMTLKAVTFYPNLDWSLKCLLITTRYNIVFPLIFASNKQNRTCWQSGNQRQILDGKGTHLEQTFTVRYPKRSSLDSNETDWDAELMPISIFDVRLTHSLKLHLHRGLF